MTGFVCIENPPLDKALTKRQLCDSGEHGVDDGRAKEGSRTGLRTSNSKRKAFWHQ